jgi:4-amino-4-deoxy-L-arabinose transferase-like glycosyltransferase
MPEPGMIRASAPAGMPAAATEASLPSSVVRNAAAAADSGRDRLLLGAVLAGALALRVYGLRWGLPVRADMNPDEETVLAIVGRMSWQNMDPGAYFYGGFFYQACVVVRTILQALAPGIDEPALVLAYRSISATFGAATVAVLYLLLRRLAPTGPAPLLGATLLAIMPLHVWDSHFAVTDVTLTFWTTACVTASIWAYQRPSLGRFLLASALAGAATGTKFNGAFATVAIALAALAAVWERRMRVGQLVAWGALGVAVALLVLFVASPHMFLQWEANWRAFRREMRRVWIPNYGFSVWAPGWQYKPYVYQFAAAFPFSFGVALYGALLAGLAYCAVRWRSVFVVPFGYAAFYLAVMGSWEFVPIRYYLPFEPALLLAPALALAAGLTAASARARRWTAVALVGVVGYTLPFTISTTARFADDTRMQAARWLQPFATEGMSILTVGARWYVPEPKGPRVSLLHDYLSMPRVVSYKRPDFVVLTSMHYARSYRQHDENVATWELLRKGAFPYRLARRFHARYLHWRFYSSLDPMFEGYFLSPTIEIYRRMD